MARISMLQQLIARGFDRTEQIRFTKGYRVRCSQCQALVINGIPTHEQRCPNIPRRTEEEDE
jgi:hypothetical protein